MYRTHEEEEEEEEEEGRAAAATGTSGEVRAERKESSLERSGARNGWMDGIRWTMANTSIDR